MVRPFPFLAKRGFIEVMLAGALAVCAAAPLGAQLGGSTSSSSAPAVQPPIAQGQPLNSSFQGSVAQGAATPGAIELSLRDAVQRGLKANLGLLTSETSDQTTRAQRLRVLSGLLPDISGNYSQSFNRINLAAEGFNISLPANSPFQIPKIVTFGVADTRINLSQSIVDLQKFRNLRSADASVRASRLNLQDTRDLVVQAVGNAYLLIIADAARVDTAQAQVSTSQTLFQRAVDQKAAGTVPAIDQLRAEVQLRTDQQAVLVAQNQFKKDKISLARVIGLPAGQEFNLTDKLPFTPLDGVTLEGALEQAFATRADFKAAQEQIRAAELARRASVAEYYPTVDFTGNFGVNGVNVGNSHNVFGLTGELRFNIFSGGRIRADIEQASAQLKSQQDSLADLRGRIDQEVRTSLLDLQSAADEVVVAQRNVQLANETLTQSRDRFSAGVTDNVEVVQAQQQVVVADTNLINANYQHNLAKIELARALGMTEQNLNRFTGGK